MPAIRDFTTALQTSTTGATITIPTPQTELNDLLVVIITADTYDASGGFTANATANGWTLIHQTINTSLQFMAYRLATASEPASYSITSTDTETYQGCIVSIRDVDITNPLGATPVRTTSNQAAANRFAMGQITTNVDKALILYAFSGTAASVPSMIEGAVHSLVAADGTAECLSVAWGFQARSGQTPQVFLSQIASVGGVKTTLQIAPPAQAQFIPPYIQEDRCTYVDPLNGTTAYNGNTAPGTTTDTNYGTSLGGFTAGDAGLAAVADVGINPYHSVARATSASTINPSGIELILATANRVNVTGKNILCHTGPSTEGQLQRFSNIASNRGIWFGMRSNTGSGGATTGQKIWQVYGLEKGSLRHQPIVIHPDAPNTKQSSGTLDANVITSFAWWVSGTGQTVGGASTTIFDFAQVWVLDETIICGGDSVNPIDIAGISDILNSKERRSFVRQGSNQAISYQPIQFGAKRNTTYLDLNATAIEFPTFYNQATKDVQYNSVSNVAGITYNADSTDVLKHRNSVISSSSPYHWRIDSASDSVASYDFSGLSLIGAGDVVLRNVTTFTDMTFSDCDLITQNNAAITGCSFTNSLINANNLSSISNCTFVQGDSVGPAINLVPVGTVVGAKTYTFSGNTFLGYDSTGTVGAAIWNSSGDSVEISIVGGGSIPTYRNVGAGSFTSIITAATLTLTGLVQGSEIRAYVGTNPATAIEIGGVESCSGSSFSFSQSKAGQTGYIQVFNLNYVPISLDITYSGDSTAIPVQQFFDRQYENL